RAGNGIDRLEIGCLCRSSRRCRRPCGIVDAASPPRRVPDPPMTARALAWRTMTAERARAGLAIAGIAVIGALLFDMLMLSSGLLVSFRALLDAAGYDVRVAATDGFALRVPLANATAVAKDIAQLPEVRDVEVVRRNRAF